MASQRSPKPHAAGSTPAALASSLTTESDNEGRLSSNGRAVGFQPADARSTRVSRSTFARVAQWTQSVRLRTGRPQVQVLPRAPYIHGWPSGRSARLQSVMSAVRFRGRGLNGPVVIMGARLACNQDVGVRFPPGPPFALASGLRRLASEAGARRFESCRAHHSPPVAQRPTRGASTSEYAGSPPARWSKIAASFSGRIFGSDPKDGSSSLSAAAKKEAAMT